MFEFPPRTPFTIQFSPLLVVPETVPLNCLDCPTCRLALVGDTDTDTAATGADTTDTEALATAVVFATLCAVTVMVLEGATVGALYKPDEEIVPVVELPPIAPLTSQLRLALLVPDTDALNCSDCPSCKVEELGEIETLTEPFLP